MDNRRLIANKRVNFAWKHRINTVNLRRDKCFYDKKKLFDNIRNYYDFDNMIVLSSLLNVRVTRVLQY